MSGVATGQAADGRTGDLVARAIVGLLALAILVTLSVSFDARFAAYAQTLPGDARTWGRLLSDIGTSGYMFTLSGALLLGALLLRGRTRSPERAGALTLLAERSAYVLATLAASGLAAQAIKHLVGRARPSLFDSFGPYHFAFLSIKNSLASFPSGHSTTAFAMAVALSLFVPSARIALFTLAAGIAASRITVQAHYLSDIVAGGALGTVSALLVAGAFARRGIAFVERGDRFELKGRGTIRAGLLR